MEETDKTYMWLIIIAFVAMATATGFAMAEWNDLKSMDMTVSDPFKP